MNENHYKAVKTAKQGEGENSEPSVFSFLVTFALRIAVPCKMSSPKCFAQLNLTFFLSSSSTNLSDCVC